MADKDFITKQMAPEDGRWVVLPEWMADMINKSEKDVMGVEVKFPINQLYERCDDFRLMGMSFQNIMDLRNEYLIRGGKEPMTSESIRNTFRPDKIEVSNG